jgi:hypothetical protein
MARLCEVPHRFPRRSDVLYGSGGGAYSSSSRTFAPRRVRSIRWRWSVAAFVMIALGLAWHFLR